MDGAMRGLADGLDPDSAFLTPGQVKAVEAGEAPPDGDVGHRADAPLLPLRHRRARRLAGAQGGPPHRGLRFARSTASRRGTCRCSKARALLRGKPGSKVTLTIIRGNAADPHEVVLVRDKVAGPLVTSAVSIGTDAAICASSSFSNGVVEELKQAGRRPREGRRQELIIDVRRTAEGPLENGIAAARVFIKSGTLAIKAGRGKPETREPVTAAAGDGAIDLPCRGARHDRHVGPGGLFVAALNDNDRAELVGERTLGRAGIQKLVKLPEGRGLWLTYARYLTPKGNPIQGKGLEPDVAVDDPDVEFGAPAPDKDPILDAALERVKRKSPRNSLTRTCAVGV